MSMQSLLICFFKRILLQSPLGGAAATCQTRQINIGAPDPSFLLSIGSATW